jgi:dihydroceramidase
MRKLHLVLFQLDITILVTLGSLPRCSVDDLSMLFTTTPVLHRVLTVNASRRDSVIMAILLGSILTGLVFYHVKTDELILHALSFASMVIVIGVRTMQLIKSRTLPGSAARRQIWGIVRFGAGNLTQLLGNLLPTNSRVMLYSIWDSTSG